MIPLVSRTWAAWLVPLALTLAGCGDSDPVALGPDTPEPDAIDTTAPSAPTSIRLRAMYHQLFLDWAPSPEQDVVGYVVYRSLDRGATWAPVTGTLAGTTFQDQPWGRVYYRVAAVDTSANQGAFSSVVGYTAPRGGPKLLLTPADPLS